MNNIKTKLLSTHIAPWRKKGLFIVMIVMSVFPFYIIYQSAPIEFHSHLWNLRHFVAIALLQSAAQISIAWYILKNNVPNYLILSFVLIVIFFQLLFGLTVIMLGLT